MWEIRGMTEGGGVADACVMADAHVVLRVVYGSGQGECHEIDQ